MTNDSENLYSIPNYCLFTNNVASDKGGVCLYIKNNLKCKLLPDFTIKTEHLETIFVLCEIDREPITIGMCYRRPGTPIALCERELIGIMDNIVTKCIIMGDLNVNILKSVEDNSVSSFLNNFLQYSFLPVINKPTRVHDFTATIIDHIYVNFDQAGGFESNIIFTHVTDHFPVAV